LREAEEWILEESTEWLFSFDNICESLGLHPKYIRGGLHQWKEKKVTNRPKAEVFSLAQKTGRKKHSLVSRGSVRRYHKAAGR